MVINRKIYIVVDTKLTLFKLFKMTVKNPDNLEEIIQQVYGDASAEHKENLIKFEKFFRRANQAKITRLANQAFDGNRRANITGATEAAHEQVDIDYKTASKDIQKDDEKLYRIGITYIRQFFENAKPSVMKSLGDHLKEYIKKPVGQLSKDELKELYEALSDQFDREVGAGQIEGVQGLANLLDEIKEEFKDDDEVTADMIKGVIEGRVRGHKIGVAAAVGSHAQAAYISHLPHGVYAAHVITRAKRRGMQIRAKDALKLSTQTPGTIAAQIHVPMIQRRRDDIKYQAHGFYDKENREDRDMQRAA